MIETYKARRRLEMQPDVWREPGELVPEAHAWHRRDSWLHTGYIEDTKVEEKDFRKAVSTYCAKDDATRVLELAGLGAADLEGPQKTPRIYQTKGAPVVAEPHVDSNAALDLDGVPLPEPQAAPDPFAEPAKSKTTKAKSKGE